MFGYFIFGFAFGILFWLIVLKLKAKKQAKSLQQIQNVVKQNLTSEFMRSFSDFNPEPVCEDIKNESGV